MSIYREEAIETLIEALYRRDFPNCQMKALEALLSLPGRLTSSGLSYIEAWLLKIAGLDEAYNSLVKAEQPGKSDNLTEIMVCLMRLLCCYGPCTQINLGQSDLIACV